MALPADLPLIPTATIGSYALPGWYQLALEHVGRGELGETDARELVEDASALAISDQERAGVDVVSDGEVRRADFIMGFYGRLRGLRQTPPHRSAPTSTTRRRSTRRRAGSRLPRVSAASPSTSSPPGGRIAW